LDSSHFSSEELDSDGSCSITSFDNKQYDIQITGPECSYTDNAKVQSDQDDVTCSNCGGEKEEYDTYCNNCKDNIENTCSRCGGYEYYVYGGLCNNCKSDDENNQEE
jgi:hypothetical protein